MNDVKKILWKCDEHKFKTGDKILVLLNDVVIEWCWWVALDVENEMKTIAN